MESILNYVVPLFSFIKVFVLEWALVANEKVPLPECDFYMCNITVCKSVHLLLFVNSVHTYTIYTYVYSYIIKSMHDILGHAVPFYFPLHLYVEITE